jgi:HAMP domain-containing protein
MTDAKQQRSSKSLVINAGFQGRIVAFIVLAGFLCVAGTSYGFYSYVAHSYDFVLRHSSLPQGLIDERYRDLFRLWVSLGIVNLLIILVVAGWALVVTHRAAGSVYHVKRVINEVRSGNLQARVRLRSKDEFQDLAASVNALLDQWPVKP